MLGNCLKEFRTKNNLTQKEMARKLRTSQPYYSTLESGAQKPGFQLVKRISRVLKIDASYIRELL